MLIALVLFRQERTGVGTETKTLRSSSKQRNQVTWPYTMLGFMHQPDESKSLSDWEEVGNPIILHNTLTHVQPEQGVNMEIKKGADDLKDASTRTRIQDRPLTWVIAFLMLVCYCHLSQCPLL
jgi:hypothetical protein